jgi:hypothetical protein
MSADKERCDGWRKSPCLSHLGNLKYFLIVAVHFGQTEMGQKEWLSAGLGPPPSLYQNPPGEVVFERDWALRKSEPRNAPMQVIPRAPHSAVMFPRVAENASASHDWVVSRGWQPLNPLTGLGCSNWPPD